jgi:hypothetical protein
MTGMIMAIMAKKDMTGVTGRIDGKNYFRWLSIKAPNAFFQTGCIKMKPVL